jgi:hypothetical protein
MKTNFFSTHLFWSYEKNADLPAEVIARQVILYGEVSDMLKLTKEVDRHCIEKIANELSSGGRYSRRIFFLQKVILD